jgi:hypothetical protein
MAENANTVSVVSYTDILMATAWRPLPGDTLTGAFVHRDVRRGGEYGDYMICYFDKNDGSPLVAVHAFHQTLKDGLKELAPDKGDIISITYAGQKVSNKRVDSKGRAVEYHHYGVYNPEAAVESADMSWDSPDF